MVDYMVIGNYIPGKLMHEKDRLPGSSSSDWNQVFIGIYFRGLIHQLSNFPDGGSGKEICWDREKHRPP